VRESYLRQAAADGWVRLDADRDRGVVATEVFEAVRPLIQHSAAG